MLKSLVTGICLALCLGACATTASTPKTAADAGKPPAGCVAQTGTMIKVPPTACTGPGNTYSQEDIDRTGRTTVAGALQTLDPSITITH
jgi:hypothetical protein